MRKALTIAVHPFSARHQVVEDSTSGIKAAKSGGFTCIMLMYDDNAGVFSDADHIATSLNELDIEQIDVTLREGIRG